ncbi:MAG: hypothetical protein OQK32_02275 [Gammaproteobacteria bacterium]|nr:hypothetical protein [Gammaproteobacteria bacterium]MCW8922971.1 hypothetical protein [Gammaproteobacteria bacterium]
MCKLCWAFLLCALVAIGTMAYKFIISGETLTAKDGRQSLMLEEGERDLVLTEMRMFLSAVQQIIQAANQDDPEAIAAAATIVGRAAQAAVPGSLMKKLPLEFKRLGFDTHNKFDELAASAKQFGDPAFSLEQLSELMQNCVSCHAAYRVDAIPAAK